jgi:hypothetical protein
MAERAGLLDGQVEEVQGPLHIDLVRALGDELRPRRQQRGQMENDGDFELGSHPVQEVAVEDVPDPHGRAPQGEVGVEGADVEGQDIERPAFRDLLDQAVSDLATGARHEDHRLACAVRRGWRVDCALVGAWGSRRGS